MYRVLILDDEPAHAQRLARMIGSSRFGVRFELACAQDVSMLCADTVERPDALFADIRLDGASDVAGGIELVRSRFPRGCGTQVVYVTGYAEYCTPVYETEHVYFLTKPVRQAELDNALRAVLANLDERRTAAIPVQTGGRLIGLVPGRVRYLESDRRKVLVHGEGPCIETYATLSGLKAQFPSSFIQCHKSFLVNMAAIEEIGARTVKLRTGESVPLSRHRRADVKEAYIAFLREQLA